jgi:hypothetical protein
VAARLLEAIPRSRWTWNYTIREGATSVGRIDTSWLRGRVTLTVRGTAYRVYRERAHRGAFFLESDGAVLARSTRSGRAPREVAVEHAGGWHTVRGESRGGRDFLLIAGDREVGAIRPEGRFTRRARASLPDGLPLPLGVFFIWLVLLAWKEDGDVLMDQPPMNFA